jgi:uncharacterized surface protein with fasciclin (FAS1) repeats
VWPVAVVLVAAALIAVVLLVSDRNSGNEQPTTGSTLPGTTDLVETMRAEGLTVLADLVVESGLATRLAGLGPFTVFGPTNEAFAALPPEDVDQLKANQEQLQQLLAYHVLKGRFFSADIPPEGLEVNTIEGENLSVTADGDTVMVNQATITDGPVPATNGVLYVINAVLVPPSLAPEVPVVTVPPSPTLPLPEATTTTLPPTTTTTAPLRNLVDTLDELPDYSTFAELLDGTIVQNLLRQTGPYTVLAPTNEAFEALDPDVLEAMEDDATLRNNVLSGMVFTGKITSSDLEPGPITAVNDETWEVEITGAGADLTVTVSGAEVVNPDVMASNGVIHGIEAVLLPPDFTIPTTTTTTTTTVPATTTGG